MRMKDGIERLVHIYISFSYLMPKQLISHQERMTRDEYFYKQKGEQQT